jgi:hypothetical protein
MKYFNGMPRFVRKGKQHQQSEFITVISGHRSPQSTPVAINTAHRAHNTHHTEHTTHNMHHTEHTTHKAHSAQRTHHTENKNQARGGFFLFAKTNSSTQCHRHSPITLISINGLVVFASSRLGHLIRPWVGQCCSIHFNRSEMCLYLCEVCEPTPQYPLKNGWFGVDCFFSFRLLLSCAIVSRPRVACTPASWKQLRNSPKSMSMTEILTEHLDIRDQFTKSDSRGKFTRGKYFWKFFETKDVAQLRKKLNNASN